MNHISIGNSSASPVVFAHGWARTHHDFIPVAESLVSTAHSVLLDLPGFGDSPRPESAWGSTEYADHCAQFIRDKNLSQVVWVGHSFGGRVGLQLAVRHPELLKGLVLVAGAGVRTPGRRYQTLNRKLRQLRFKLAKRRAANDEEMAAIERQFGSADYIQSAELGLRDIFIKVINEDQSSDAAKIKTPTRLIYGGRDQETPVAIGEKLNQLITDSQLIRCEEFGHIDILNRGRHQIAVMIKDLVSGESS